MNDIQNTEASKFLSLILRHKPETIGITLDSQGWALVQDIIQNSQNSKIHFTENMLKSIVSTCQKQRFEFSEDHTKIRCRQGHSINIDLGLESMVPPEYLFHGTATRFLQSILAQGIKKQKRQHVHLSVNITTATSVGTRYGEPVILRISARKMVEDGYVFYLSANGVWLTDSVPPHYIVTTW